MHCWGGLFERLTATGVWATRPHLSCVTVKEGDSPTFILSGCKGGRVALPPLLTALFWIIASELNRCVRSRKQH